MLDSHRSLRLGALAALVALCLSVGAGGAAAASARAASGVTVFAAASLTQVFPAIAPGDTYSFAGSNALATQITNGAPADVFASAAPKNMSTVVSAGDASNPQDSPRTPRKSRCPRATRPTWRR